jgi:type I restriction enzyme S subunit
MTEWKEVVIGDYINLISGYAFKSANFFNEQVENSLPVIKIKNVANGDTNLDDAVFHMYDNSLEKFLLKKGDVLIAMTGNHPHAMTQVVGDVSRYKLDNNSLLNQRVGKLVAKDGTNLDFLYYLFKDDDVQYYLANQSSGSANQANISKGDILGLNLRIPPLPEQRAIASALSSLDDKIDLLHRQNKTLEEMAEALFRQWFVVGADDEWRVVKLGDYISTNTTSINKDYPHEKIEYLDTGSLTLGKWGDLKTVFLKEAPSRAKRLVKHNDILYSTVRPNQLHYGIVRNPIENLVVSTGFCVITCNSVSPYFVYYLLTDNGMTEYLHSIAEGSTSAYPSLKPSDLESLEFPFPTVNILEKFHKLVDSVWNKIESNYKQIRTLEKLRDTLLPKLMSGEVRVKK